MARNTPADLARRRQAIYLGLIANLQESQAQAGLRLWDAGYGQTRPTAIIDFVSELATQLGLPPKQRHEVRMGLYQALLKYDAGREPPPAAAVTERSDEALGPLAQTLSPTLGPPAYAVFNKVATEILNTVREDGSIAVHDFVASLEAQGAGSGLRSEELQPVLLWARGAGSLSGLIHSREEVLGRAVHALYVAACEALGPVAADRMLAQAVAAAEALPEARRFPARRFL